jgi:hypothetical protein
MMTGPDRPKLSLQYGRKNEQRPARRRTETPLGTLPTNELRRMVLEMVG